MTDTTNGWPGKPGVPLNKSGYVIRLKCGSYLQGYESGCHIIGKKRHAIVFINQEDAEKAAQSAYEKMTVEKIGEVPDDRLA
jgi:hypothetical protein